MSALFAKASSSARQLWQCRCGDAVVEFALALPVLMLLFAALVEMGRLASHAAMLEKALRTGGLYAAISEQPLAAADVQRAINLVRTGTTDGEGDVLIPGLADERSEVAVGVRSFDLDGSSISVIRISARVPYHPLLGDLIKPLGLDGFVLEFDHEQPALDN